MDDFAAGAADLVHPGAPSSLLLPDDMDYSRRDTTRVKVSYLAGAPGLLARPGERAWVRHGLRVRVADRRRDRDLAANIIRNRHYIAGWPVPPEKKFMSYLGDLEGATGGNAGAAALATVALLPNQYHVRLALGLHQLDVLTLVRTWRADDLGPAVAPDLTPEVLRRVVRGERNRGPLRDLVTEWCARKCDAKLRAVPRLLATYADPEQGHDGALYLAAGATYCGVAACGKLLFAWALDPALREPLRQLGCAAQERRLLAAT